MEEYCPNSTLRTGTLSLIRSTFHSTIVMALALLPSLFKAALLLSHALCTYYGMTPPTPPPRRTEEKPNRIVIPDFLNRAPTLQKTLTLCAKVSHLRPILALKSLVITNPL